VSALSIMLHVYAVTGLWERGTSMSR